MKNTLAVLWIGLVLLITGCIKNNPDPSWIEINEFSLVANPNLTEGDLDMHAFTHGWVYVDNKFIGVFQLPCKIPVLMSGAKMIRVTPTIYNNGIGETKLRYPFVESYEVIGELVQNQTLTVNPVTKYSDGTSFFIENFEAGNVKLHAGDYSATNLVVESIDGSRVGKVSLNSEAKYWSAYLVNGSDNEFFTFPFGSTIFLEMEVKNTVNLITTFHYGNNSGVLQSQDNYGVTTVRPGWKKIYFELTESVSNSLGSAFYFGFRAELADGQSSGEILLDNIKIVYK